MKKKLFFALIAAACIACTKEQQDQPRPQACGYVFDKFFTTWPPDTTKTYYLWVASDTIQLPPPAPLIRRDSVKVLKSVYDTMLVAGQPYPPQYCY